MKPFLLPSRAHREPQAANDNHLPIPPTEPTSHVLAGDAGALLQDFPDDYFHAMICDPPYGLVTKQQRSTQALIAAWVAGKDLDTSAMKGLFGLGWDSCVPQPSFWREGLRVLRPGAFAFVFAHPRTSHLTTLSAELAGFQNHDKMAWIYKQGPTRGEDACIAIDRELLRRGGERLPPVTPLRPNNYGQKTEEDRGFRRERDGQYIAKTPAGEAMRGYRPDLRAAHEEILVFRKPIAARNQASNHLQHGAGFMNVGHFRNALNASGDDLDYPFGQYPANVLGDFGGALDRYFYAPKASAKEGNRYLPEGVTNDHPCKKPIALLRYLTRLTCPEGGTVLDPFCGSGSGGVAALLEGRSYVGIEGLTKWVNIARARIAGCSREQKSQFSNIA